ncbi:hypothetical protein HDV57DRAFT_492055 [Trichoderma longibrachiatum]
MYMCVPYLTRRAEGRAECHRKPLRRRALCLCALFPVRACFACLLCLPARWSWVHVAAAHQRPRGRRRRVREQRTKDLVDYCSNY